MNALAKVQHTALAKSSADVRTKSTLEVYLQFLIYLHFSAALCFLAAMERRDVHTNTIRIWLDEQSFS